MANKDLILKHGDIFIDLNKLELNKIYNNWRDVCDALGVDYDRYKVTKSKEYLLAKIGSMVEYEHQINHTRDYRFTMYKTKPLIDLTNMRKKNKVAKLALINNIVKYVDNNPNDYSGTIVFSWDKMLSTLGMVNPRYFYYRDKNTELADKLSIPDFVTEDFYESSKQTLKRAVKAGLNSLQKDGAIIWYPAYRIWYHTKTDSTNIAYICDDSEIKMVMEANDKTYEYIYDNYVKNPENNIEYDFDTKKEKAIGYMAITESWGLYYSTRNNIFQKIWNNENEHKKYRIFTGIFKVIKIIENMYRFKKYSEILSNYEFNPYEITGIMQNVLAKNAKNRHNKADYKFNKLLNDNSDMDDAIQLYMVESQMTQKEINRLYDDFEYDFWCTIEYCTEDAYKASTIIKELNI